MEKLAGRAMGMDQDRDRLIHIKHIDNHYLGHNLEHLDRAVFKCLVCQIEIIFAQNKEYWEYNPNMRYMNYINKIYELTCQEQQIKNLLE
jgi:hypothetical protein